MGRWILVWIVIASLFISGSGIWVKDNFIICCGVVGAVCSGWTLWHWVK